MEEMTNIHWVLDYVTLAALQERKNLLLASGDYPDMFWGATLTGDEMLNYGSQGILIKLENLIDNYGPNIKKFFDDRPLYRRMANAADGNLYGLTAFTDAPRDGVATKLWINHNWLSNLGLSMPKTLDEYYNTLVAFRDRDPNRNGQRDEIPISFSQERVAMTRGAFLAAFGVMYSNQYFDLDSNGKVYFIPTSDAYRDYLIYMNRLFTEKLLDNECFIQNRAQYVAKGNLSILGSFSDLASYVVDTMDHYTWYTAVPPLTSARNPNQTWPTAFPVQFGAGAITNKNKHPEATMRWLDFFYTHDGSAILNQGPYDLGWFYIDREKSIWDKHPIPPQYASSEEYRGVLTPGQSTVPYYITRAFILGLAAPHVVNLEDQIAIAYLPHMKDSFPILALNANEQREAGVLSTDINKYVEQMEARFITGDANLNTWDNYVRDLNNMRVERYTEIYQGVYNRFMGR